MQKRRIWLLASATALATFVTGASAQREERRGNAGQALALVGGTLIDGTGGPVTRNSVVLIRGERIERVGTIGTLQVPTGYERVKFVSADRMAPGAARAIVEEAHAAGLKTTAHGRTDAEIRAAVAAGVDELQHVGTQSPEYPEDLVAAIRQRVRQGPPLSWSPTVGPDLNADELAANPEYLDDARNYRGLARSSPRISAKRWPKRRHVSRHR